MCDDDLPTNLVAGDDLSNRHSGGSNLLWLDGHAKWVKAEKIERVIVTGDTWLLPMYFTPSFGITKNAEANYSVMKISRDRG